jgi:hypothetical protein
VDNAGLVTIDCQAQSACAFTRAEPVFVAIEDRGVRGDQAGD